MFRRRFWMGLLCGWWLVSIPAWTASEFQSDAVVSQDRLASEVGRSVLRAGGNAIDAAVATAFALAVTHPAAGNIGGGGFLVVRRSDGQAVAYDFRERAPAGAGAEMFLTNGVYDATRHHSGHGAVGVPGTVAGLHLAWSEHGRLPWKKVLAPAIRLARRGFPVSPWLAGDLAAVLPAMRPFPASVAQFSRGGRPFLAGETLRQKDLARTLGRIAEQGPKGFYEGETASLIEREMNRHGVALTRRDLATYRAIRREPVRGTYRGYEILAMPPPSSGGIALVMALNLLEGFDLGSLGFGSAEYLHLEAEALRRVFADRARWLGDPDFNPDLPVARLVSKGYAGEQRRTISLRRASVSSPGSFQWPVESSETTHLSVVDRERNAVALTFTLEESYGSKIVVPGAGFLLNNELGDFNAGPGLTSTNGLVGTPPNLAAPGKRMLSSMSPTLLTRDGRLVLVTGSPGGRTIISTVLGTILATVDFGMNAAEAVGAARIHHQWLPDVLQYERRGFSPEVRERLEGMGHRLRAVDSQGCAQVIRVRPDGALEAAADGRSPDSAAAGH